MSAATLSILFASAVACGGLEEEEDWSGPVFEPLATATFRLSAVALGEHAAQSVRIGGQRVDPGDLTTPRPVDGKYPCVSGFAPECVAFDDAGAALLAGLCPSEDFPPGVWNFTYELYAGPDCTGMLLNPPAGDPLECFESDDLPARDHPNATKGEPLHPGEDNHNAIICLEETTNFLVYAGTGPVATRIDDGTMTVSYPAGTDANDLLFLVQVNATNQAPITPAGWTPLADQASAPNQFRFTVWWRLAGAESSVNLTVDTNAQGVSAWVVRYRRPSGYPPSPALATATVRQGQAAAGPTLTPSPNVTTNQPDATVISLVAIREDNTLSLATPQGFTLRNATTSTPAQGVALGVADLRVPAAGTTPPSPTWGQAPAPYGHWGWVTVAFH